MIFLILSGEPSLTMLFSGNARLAGLEKDLKLKGFDYNIILTAFYISYIIFEIPSNLMCKQIGPGKWLPFISFGFGLLSLATAFVRNKGEAFAVRFLLGAFEAGMLPGIGKCPHESLRVTGRDP